MPKIAADSLKLKALCAAEDLRECEGSRLHREAADVLTRMIEAGGRVRLDLPNGSRKRGIMRYLRDVAGLTGRSGAYQIDLDRLFTAAAEAVRESAACAAADRASDRVMAHDLDRYRRDRP